MDHHAMMWDVASHDLAAENAESALVNALSDLSGVQAFTHSAATRDEYGHRMALATDRIISVCAAWGADPDAVQQELNTSFGHVLAAREAFVRRQQEQRSLAAQARMQRQAAASGPPAPPQTPAKPDTPDAAPVGASDAFTPDTTAKTSKPRTLPSGGPAAMPMPAPVAPGIAPGPAPMAAAPAAPGAQAAPAGTAKAASRRAAIEADIAALNPDLPQGTITRLAKAAMRHLAAEPLAYGNWENVPDGPITNTLKNWSPPGLDEGGDQDGDSPKRPPSAGTATDAAAPAESAITDAMIASAAAR